ncbi:MAG TPA: histidine kinase, partial [Puia sp.]|nr:histidine kinase [Puia sp.]
TGMFAIYRQKGDYDKSFSYARKLYDIAELAGNEKWLSASLRCLGEIYSLENNYPDALNYYRKAWTLSRSEIKKDSAGQDEEIRFKMEFTEAFSQLNLFDSAWYYYYLFKPAGETLQSVYLVSTGECYYLQGNFQQALNNFQSALGSHQETHNVNEIMRTLSDISKASLALGDAATALQYGRASLEMALNSRINQYIRDGYKILSEVYASLDRTDSSNYYFRKYSLVKEAVLNDLVKAKFAAYQFEEKITLINKENQIQAIQLQKESLLKKILLGSFAALSILAFAFFRISKLKRKNEERKRLLAENELQIQKLEAEKKQAEALQQRSELEMKALRARMNPHFIFNCLNSINRFVITHKPEIAADYLTKFAKLMRMVLERSAKPFIPLDEELDALKLYIDLEAIRFERPFTYEINNPRFDPSSVLIPTLLIQPFVENAIWHGLYPREGQGKITIDLKLYDELLLCEISDNGIGRPRSAAMKRNIGEQKQSLGIALTMERLELASTPDPGHTGVSIRDLTDPDGNNIGTCVVLRIPVKIA